MQQGVRTGKLGKESFSCERGGGVGVQEGEHRREVFNWGLALLEHASRLGTHEAII